MSDVDSVNAVLDDVWLSLSDDWTGLWEIISDVRRHFPRADDAEVRRLSELVVCELVGQGVRVGEIFGGPGFTPWEGDVAAQVFAAWDELGHEPNVYEVAWFDLPDMPGAEPS